MIRAAFLLIAFAALAPAWVESVEFPWNAYPKHLWERELAWMKNIGITRVSLPPGPDPAQLTDLIRILRSLDMEADLEGPVPDALQPLTRAHGGPLTDPLPQAAVRLSLTAPDALARSRELLASGVPAVLWTDVEDTLDSAGYHRGAVNFAGQERPAAAILRRDAQLSTYWARTFPSMHETTAAGARTGTLPKGIAVKQFVSENGISLVSVVNNTAAAWTGDLKALYPPAKRTIGLLGVTVPANNALWFPVNVPLMSGPLCKDCNAFATVDHVVYATAEMTGMEYENGILAMEFAAPSSGQVVLQLSREPSGPLVAGGKPVSFDWDDHEMRARLSIPAGSGPGSHVRIGLAIEPPDATAFFDSARVLMIGETNRLPAQFSSEAISQRSRLRIAPGFGFEQAPGKNPLALTYTIKVPGSAVHGDHAELAIEADGTQMSHARPQLLNPASLRFADAISVHLAADSALALSPALVPVNQRTGREITVTIRNNAPEIRSFHLALEADGLEFSPAKIDIVVGASTSRDTTLRVFARDAAPGLHAGVASLSGAAAATEPVRFLVIPQNGAVAYSADGFSAIENARFRATFIPGRWLELVDKDTNQNLLGNTGVPFTAGAIETRSDALNFAGERTVKLEDLQALAPKPKR